MNKPAKNMSQAYFDHLKLVRAELTKRRIANVEALTARDARMIQKLQQSALPLIEHLRDEALSELAIAPEDKVESVRNDFIIDVSWIPVAKPELLTSESGLDKECGVTLPVSPEDEPSIIDQVFPRTFITGVNGARLLGDDGRPMLVRTVYPRSLSTMMQLLAEGEDILGNMRVRPKDAPMSVIARATHSMH